MERAGVVGFFILVNPLTCSLLYLAGFPYGAYMWFGILCLYAIGCVVGLCFLIGGAIRSWLSSGLIDERIEREMRYRDYR